MMAQESIFSALILFSAIASLRIIQIINLITKIHHLKIEVFIITFLFQPCCIFFFPGLLMPKDSHLVYPSGSQQQTAAKTLILPPL